MIEILHNQNGDSAVDTHLVITEGVVSKEHTLWLLRSPNEDQAKERVGITAGPRESIRACLPLEEFLHRLEDDGIFKIRIEPSE